MQHMTTFWRKGDQLELLDQWAEKDAAIAEAEAPVHSAEHLTMATWLNMSNVDQERIVNAYIPRRLRRTAQAA